MEESDLIKSRSTAVKKKEGFREQQAEKMKRAYEKNLETMKANVGDTVSIKIDPRDIPGAHGIVAIAYRVGKGGRIFGVTAHGIIATNKKAFCVPLERYGVLKDAVPLSKEMQDLKNSVKDNKFLEKKHPMVTLQQVHRLQHECVDTDSEDNDGDGKKCKGCNCKKVCKEKWCGCMKRKNGCSSNCKCKDKCGNPFNELERGVL